MTTEQTPYTDEGYAAESSGRNLVSGPGVKKKIVKLQLSRSWINLQAQHVFMSFEHIYI